jgi:hypothetical protein
MIQLHSIDRFDSSFGVGICGEEHTFGIRIKFDRLNQSLDAVHLGHAMIHQHQGHGIVTLLQPAQ